MNIRYLYGKREFLMPVIQDKKGIRLSDLTHYSRMENENMRDNEMEKIFTVDKNQIRISIGDYQLNANEMACDPSFTLTPRHCYCLCLTSRRDDSELYEKFKSDICIGFDVDKLLQHLEVLSGRFPGITFKGQDVKYYHPGTPPGTFMPDELVFYKPAFFTHEAEYRIALFYPDNKTGFTTKDGKTIPFKMDGESMHMEIGHTQAAYISGCVTEVLYP
jgi:hypothetical protein